MAGLERIINERKNILEQYPSSKEIFLDSKNNALSAGTLFAQKDLAKTLRTIAEKGVKGFYTGWVANAIVKQQKELKGIITHKDLQSYRTIQRAPLKGNYRGYDIYSMSSPSSGGTHIIQILNMVENDPLEHWGPGDWKSIHLISSAMQLAFADRAHYLGDADWQKVPLKGLTNKKYAQTLRAKIKNDQYTSLVDVKAGDPWSYESNNTTHFTLMAKDGTMISSTQTINGNLGSGVIVPGTGILLNNEMDDFATKAGSSNLFGVVGGQKNLPQPKKRPLSSMSPTLVFDKNGKPVMAVGTPSGPRILTCVTQTILNYLTFQLPLKEAVMRVRYHHQWSPDELYVEDNHQWSLQTNRQLQQLGYKIIKKDLGCTIQAVTWENGMLHGVSDLRSRGSALGY